MISIAGHINPLKKKIICMITRVLLVLS